MTGQFVFVSVNQFNLTFIFPTCLQNITCNIYLNASFVIQTVMADTITVLQVLSDCIMADVVTVLQVLSGHMV